MLLLFTAAKQLLNRKIWNKNLDVGIHVPILLVYVYIKKQSEIATSRGLYLICLYLSIFEIVTLLTYICVNSINKILVLH